MWDKKNAAPHCERCSETGSLEEKTTEHFIIIQN